MANEQQQQQPSKPPVELSAGNLMSMQAGLGLLTQMNSVLYEMSKHPIASALSVYGLDIQMTKLIGHVKHMREEAKRTNTEFATLKDHKTWLAVGTALISVGLSLKAIRSELAETQISLYRIRGRKMTGDDGFSEAFGFTRKTIELQKAYGKEYVKIFKQNVNDVQSRLMQEGMAPGRQQQFLEIITGLTKGTGVQYGKAVDTLQGAFARYGSSSEDALASAELIRNMWENQSTALGDLNENMNASIELLVELASKGLNLPRAAAVMQSMNLAARQIGLDPRGMVGMYRANEQLGAFGSQGVMAREKFSRFLPNNDATRRLFEPYARQGMSRAQAMFVMQKEDPKAFLGVMQEFARSIVPVNRFPLATAGQTNWSALSGTQSQMFKEMQLPPGWTVDMLSQLAEGKTLGVGGTPEGGMTLEDMKNKLAGKKLEDFAAGLDAALRAATIFADKLGALWDDLVRMNPAMGKVLNTGLPETIMEVGGGALNVTAGVWLYDKFKKRGAKKLAEAAAKAASEAAETAAKVAAEAAELASRPKFLKIVSEFGEKLPFRLLNSVLPGMEVSTGTFSYPEFKKKVGETREQMGYGNVFAQQTDEPTAAETAAIAARKQSPITNGAPVTVNMYLDGRLFATVASEQNARERSTVPPLLARP